MLDFKYMSQDAIYDYCMDDAYAIAYVGASNARGVALTLQEWLVALEIGQIVKGNEFHQRFALPLRLMHGHLGYLLARGLGPSYDDLGLLAKWKERTK